MAFRALTLASRFLLLFGLARLLAPADVGLYGLIAGTISFSMLFIGGEFYTYSQRELLATDRDHWSFVLQHQALAIGLLYLFLLPLQLPIFGLDLIPGRWLFWFMALLVAEHVAQELNRLLVAMGRPVLASWVLLLRTGAWIWILLPLLWLRPDLRRLEPVFLAWLIGVAVAIATALAAVARDVPDWRWWPVDWTWLRRGFKVGLLFLGSTLCFKAMFTADRYLVERLAGRDLLGVYVVYAGVATAVVNFLDSAVFSFLYPRLVAAHQKGDHEGYSRARAEMIWSASAVSVALAVLAGLLGPMVLSWIGKAVYVEHLPLLWLLLTVSVVQSLGMIPHYGLYARRADRAIVGAHISSLLVFLVVAAALARVTPVMAAPWGLLAAMLWMAGFKAYRYRGYQLPSAGAVT